MKIPEEKLATVGFLLVEAFCVLVIAGVSIWLGVFAHPMFFVLMVLAVGLACVVIAEL